MKLSHTIGISGSVGAICLLIGLMNTSGTGAKAAGIVGAVGSGGTTLIAASHIMQKRKIKLEAELSKSRSQLATAKREVEISKRELHDMENSKKLLTQLRGAIGLKEKIIETQTQKISTVQGELGRAIVVSADLSQAHDQALARLSQAEKDKTALTAEITQLEQDYESELKIDIEKAIATVRDSLDFEVRTESLAMKEKIVAVYDKLDGLFKALADQNSMLSSAYREDVGSMAGTVAELTGEINNFAAHKAQLEEQYQEQVQALESQLKREYQEPIYLDAQFNPSLQAANAIIKSLYQDMGIAVEGMGGSVDDGGLVRFGVLPSFSIEGEALAKQINQRSKNLAQSLKLGQAPKARYCPEFRAIEIVFRRDVKPVAEVPPRFVRQDFQGFVKHLLAPNVPAIRIMGESGSGKSSITRLLLSEANKIHPLQILLHDPQAGTDEDRWEIPATHSDASTTGKALKNLAKDVENKARLTNRTFHVFDELDGLCKSDKDVKSGLLTIAKKARHIHGLHVLFMGQSSNVGNQGLQWADMGNFAAVYIGESALHGIEKSPVLAAIANKLKPQYQEVSEYCEGKNTALNLEGFEPEAYRFALVNIPGKQPYFLLIPAFSEGIPGYMDGEAESLITTLDEMDEPPGHASKPKLESLAIPLDILDIHHPVGVVDIHPKCPSCGSEKLTSKGDRWVCKSCKKTFAKSKA